MKYLLALILLLLAPTGAIAQCNGLLPAGTACGSSVYPAGTNKPVAPISIPSADVRNFGAKCDGVSDDTAAFTAAAIWASEAGNATIMTGAVIDVIGSCVTKNIAWPPFASFTNTVTVRINGILQNTDPKGLNWPVFVTYEGVGGGPAAQFQASSIGYIKYAGGNNATFTGTGSGTSLTTTSVTGTIVLGGLVSGTGVPTGTVIIAQVSGPVGGAGVYTTNHATTSSGASLTEGGIGIHGYQGTAVHGMRNIVYDTPVNGVGMFIDCATATNPVCASIFRLENVGTESPQGAANVGAIPLELMNIQDFECWSCSFQGAPTGGPSISFVTTAAIGVPNSYVEFHHLQIAFQGIEISGTGAAFGLNDATFDNVIYESAYTDPIIINSSTGITNVSFDHFIIADPISVSFYIDNNTSGCSNVQFSHVDVAGFPIVKNNSPLCSITINGWWANFVGTEFLNMGTDAANYEVHQGGRFDGYFLGRGASFGPTTVPGTPLTTITQDPSTWSALGSNVTVTTGVLAPDGTTNAAKITSPSAGFVEFFPSTGGMAAGGFLIVGAWQKCDGGTSPSTQSFVSFNGAVGASFTASSSPSSSASFSVAFDMETTWQTCTWKPITGWGKIAALGAATQILFALGVDSTHPTDYFMPWAIYIPPNTTTDDEIIRWTRHLSTVVSTASAGQAAMRQPLFMDKYGIHQANNSDANALASTTFSGPATVTRVIGTTATPPTANSCAGFALGTGSSDFTGKVSYTSATTCSVTFGTAFTNAPFCSITPGSAASTTQVTTSTTGFAVTFGTANTSFFYTCTGT